MGETTLFALAKSLLIEVVDLRTWAPGRAPYGPVVGADAPVPRLPCPAAGRRDLPAGPFRVHLHQDAFAPARRHGAPGREHGPKVAPVRAGEVRPRFRQEGPRDVECGRPWGR
jgi:hypothetical protein